MRLVLFVWGGGTCVWCCLFGGLPGGLVGVWWCVHQVAIRRYMGIRLVDGGYMCS